MRRLLNISDAASIAMHTLIALAVEPDEMRSTGSIAEELDISEAHLSKVLQRLTKGRYVRSFRGPKGGFKLAVDPAELTMLEIFEYVEGPLLDSNCLLELDDCHNKECCFSPMLQEVTETVRRHLGQTRLSTVARQLRHQQQKEDVAIA